MAGTAAGHSVPGLAVVILSIWWIYNMYKNYYKSKENNTAYKSSTWFPSGKKSNRPTEIVWKLVFTSLGLVRQTVAVFYLTNQHPDHTTVHATILILFLVQALVELLRFYKLSSLPPRAEYLTLSIVFFSEGILFYFHNSHEKSPYEALFHTLLMIAIAGSFMSTVLEAHFNRNVTVSLTRAFFLLLQGTWLFHIGCIMYASTSAMNVVYDDSNKVTSHGELMFMVVFFVWHIAVDLIVVFLIGSLVGWRFKRMKCCLVDCNSKCFKNGGDELLVLSGDLSN